MTDSTPTGWYYALQGERVGPRSLDDVRALVANGVLDDDALVWTPGMREWARVGDVSILSPGWVPPQSAPAPRAEAEWVPVQTHGPGTPAEPAPRPWRRFMARLVDLVLYAVLLTAPMQLVAPDFVSRIQARPAEMSPLVSLAISCALGLMLIVMDGILLHLRGTTVGKALFGVRVVNADGTRVSLGRSFSRSARMWVLGMGAGLPFLNILAPIAALVRLASHGRTHWDEALDLRVEHTEVTAGRVFAILGSILLFLYFVGALVATVAPPTP